MCDKCKCKDLLKRRNISITDLRRLTIKILTFAQRNLTPDEILKEARKSHTINKVTLYRILALLEKKEIVRKILTSDKISRYELIDPQAIGKQSLPPRFTCRKCKAIIPLNSPEVESIVKTKLGNEFTGPIEITIEGICPNCRKENK
ncbi:MAG: transcriptional repressor [Candidatus Omnitrophica bacterium]|nr:transcriptional repressor [Candidatus Omnitrophota bacterium]